jgi:photosystem II stability/assembly factor-like uncharacterized protein
VTRLLRTDDFGVTWTDASEGIDGAAVVDVVASATPTLLWSTNGSGPYRSDDGGATWIERSGPDPSIWGAFGPFVRRVVAHPQDSEVALAGQLGPGDVGGGILRTQDGGASWQRVFTARPEMVSFQAEDKLWDPVELNRVYFAIHYRDNESLGFTDGGIFASSNGGESFVEVLDEMSFPALARSSSGALYAMGGSNLSRRPGLWRSADDGATWQRVGAGVLPEGIAANDLAADAEAGDRLFALLTDGSLWVTEGGATWGRIAVDGLPDPRPFATRLAVLPPFPRRVLLGTQGGLYEAAVECLPSPTALCLGGGRFRVEVSHRAAEGTYQQAQVLPLTSDTGAFWFFNEANLELVVKLLDGCGLNDSFWVFAAGLTNVGVRVTVTDTWTTNVKSYEHEPGTPYPVLQDTGAFAGCDTELDLARQVTAR